MGKKKDPVQVADEFMQNGSEEPAESQEEPKAPKWVKYDEVKPLVMQLIEAYPEQLGHIKPSSIGYAAFSKKRSKNLAKIFPMRPMYGLFSTVDYIMTVHIESWAVAAASKKYVLVFHELSHIPAQGFDASSKDYRKTVDHNVKDFDFLIREFGINWEESDKILKGLKKDGSNSAKDQGREAAEA